MERTDVQGWVALRPSEAEQIILLLAIFGVNVLGGRIPDDWLHGSAEEILGISGDASATNRKIHEMTDLLHAELARVAGEGEPQP